MDETDASPLTSITSLQSDLNDTSLTMFKDKLGVIQPDCLKEQSSSTSFFKPGSVNASVLNLIAATMGAGTITMPYIICRAGIGLGVILTILGACLSHYTGNLLVSSLTSHPTASNFLDTYSQIKCTVLTGKSTFEDFAEAAFGSKKWRSVVAVSMIVSLLGFTTAYISLSKTLIPSIVEVTVSEETYASLPLWLQNTEQAKTVWATVFSFGVLLPLACFRKLSMLRFTSFFGVVCSTILMLVLIYEYIFDTEVVP